MSPIFADTSFWIALLNPRDQWYKYANTIADEMIKIPIATTDEVLVETLTYFSGFGAIARRSAAQFVTMLHTNPNATVFPQSRESFFSGLELYRARSDKKYSFTDCISMYVIKHHSLSKEIFTNDRHFEQEGFKILMKEGIS